MKRRTKTLAFLTLALASFAALWTSSPAAQEPAAAPAEERAAFEGDEAGELRTLEINGVAYRFRWAPPGSFTMGGSEAEQEYGESAYHVTLTRGFWILETEVTQAMWNSTASFKRYQDGRADYPADSVSWNDAQRFIAALNETGAAPVGAQFALPTEAQWEYACRAGTTTAFFWGDSLNGDKANCNGQPYGTDEAGAFLGEAAPVGSYEANPWGLFDMHGNALEWCGDRYGDYPSSGVLTDPRGPDRGESRVMRGGSWRDEAGKCRSASRGGAHPDFSDGGFRLVLVPLVEEIPQETVNSQEAWTASFAGQEPGELRELTISGVDYRFRWAPPGSFVMGSPETEFQRGNDEAPHDVTLTQGFWILETEITQLMWRSIMGDFTGEFKGANLPVESVSWNDCQSFVASLNEGGFAPAGYRFALPTEAQWEYACRAGTTTPFFWGDSLNGDRANCDGRRAYGTEEEGEYLKKTALVGSYAANPWGIFDMHGNVAEWCEDWYGYDYPSDAATEPLGPESGPYRVARGGSWNYDARFCRSAYRDGEAADKRSAAVGFRVVLLPHDAQLEGATPDEVWSSSFAGQKAGDLRVISMNGVSYRFRWTPAGSFTMGSPETEARRSDVEIPHRVELSRGFWTLETEVTQAMWNSFGENNSSEFKGADLPITNVTKGACQEFVNRLDRLGLAPAGTRFALPTEAQWEYACRAGTTTPFSWGDALNGDKANCDGTLPYGTDEAGANLRKTVPVGSYDPNPWGLFDMHGNVAEWCDDNFEEYYLAGSITDPRGPDGDRDFAARGGGWRDSARDCRSASRTRAFGGASSSVGFRFIVVPIAEQEPGAAPAEVGASSLAEAQAAAQPVEEWTSSVAGKEAGELRVVEVNGVPYRFRWAPPGSFAMGSSEAEAEEEFNLRKESIIKRFEESGDEPTETELDSILSFERARIAEYAKRHDVTLTHGFWILETELTQEMWESVMENNPSELKGADLPVGGVSWHDCQHFLRKLNNLGAAPAGSRFALPTEAQWECACRAGTTTPFYWGDALNGDKANCDGTRPFGTREAGVFLDRTTPGGTYEANPWGLFDMCGNVSEWCEDRYGPYPSAAVADPLGSARGVLRAHRGGGWGYDCNGCRSASRFCVPAEKRYAAVGFRPVLAPLTKEPLQGEEPTAPVAATPAEEWTASFAGWEAGDLRVIDVDGVPYRLRWVPPGSFTMGSPQTEQEEIARPMKEQIERIKEMGLVGVIPNDETLKDLQDALAAEVQRDVTLTEGFWTLETEVTQLMWRSLMGYNPSEFEGAAFNLPVDNVSWDHCQAFVAELNERGIAPVGTRFALPTEAQWEYACRAGTTTPFSYGDSLTFDQANFLGARPSPGNTGVLVESLKTAPVGSYPANPWGLFDMHGNVEEWCEDWYGAYPTDAVTDPRGPADGEYRVKRGGSCFQEPDFCRSAARANSLDLRNIRVGFRVVLVPLSE